MKNRLSNEHLSAERLQAFLEGDLPDGEAVHVEEHLAGCARCSAELDGWRILFEDLGGLAPHRPIEGFADRVMAGVQTGRVPALGEHVAADVLQDFLEGSLAARKASRIEAHLESQQDYQVNRHEMDQTLRDRVFDRWGEYFEPYGYRRDGSMSDEWEGR